MDFRAVIDETRTMLAENTEWRCRYAKYAESIISNQETISSARREFRKGGPFKFYLTTSRAVDAQEGRTVYFDARYLGQSVATLRCLGDDIRLSTKDCAKFDWATPLDKEPWRGEQARAFRKHFIARSEYEVTNARKEEHRLESLLLTAFAKRQGIHNVQPIDMAGLRYPMPTPLKASDKKTIQYAGSGGGSIDMFVRTGTGWSGKLCIMELKDQYEPADNVLRQALIYTVFIRELLRSEECGQKWWGIFGKEGKVSQPLVLYATCVMPMVDGAETAFAGKCIPFGEDTEDRVELHYAYFKEENNKILSITSSLPGTTL